MDSYFNVFIDFLVARSPYSSENQSFWMAVQGAMAVRKGPNKDHKLNWFHAFSLSVLLGFAGGIMGTIWMGKPSPMLANDLNMVACILAFALVNYTPGDVGFKILDTLPFRVITVAFAQLFRAMGIVKFVNVCFETFKETPSQYYPIPVFGPILYATMLGNMGSFISKGLEGHVANGMPWPFQNGVFCATFYHFFVNDQKGPIGIFLRSLFPTTIRLGLDDTTFAKTFISFFMQWTGLLQMQDFLGPSFSPFDIAFLTSVRASASESKKVGTQTARQNAIQKQKKN